MKVFNDMLGKTIVAITGGIGTDEIVFTLSDGTRGILFHEQDCCESCNVVDIVGDLNDLIGHPLLMAEEVESNENPVGILIPEWQESFTWTFYKLATIKGYVTISWYGESNGYYNESVSFRQEGSK